MEQKKVLTKCRVGTCTEIIEVSRKDYDDEALIRLSDVLPLPYYTISKKLYCASCKREAILKDLIGKKWYQFWK
jgi:hypothetical protein